MNEKKLYEDIKPYAKADLRKSIFQLVNTLVPYLMLLTWMVVLYQNHVAYGIILLLAVPTGSLMVRTFIIFHDCTHQSFFNSRRANDIVGFITGVIAFTPYGDWQNAHKIHHGTVGNLSKRGVGDVWTLTVEEYTQSPLFTKFIYRAFRSPIILLIFAPTVLFLMINRFPTAKTGKKERQSVLLTNLALLVIVLIANYTIGLGTYIAIQFPVLVIAATMGVWMFYVQHQFEEVYWREAKEWSIYQAAMVGSSYYKLPAILNWVTGNIGYHNIHHLNPRIPNYNLKACFELIPDKTQVPTLNIGSSLKTMLYQIYDEQNKKMISFRKLHKMRRLHTI